MPEWTNEPPTEPGWYWNYNSYWGVFMYRIHRSERDGTLWTDENGEYDRAITNSQFSGNLWCGPVEPPEVS